MDGKGRVKRIRALASAKRLAKQLPEGFDLAALEIAAGRDTSAQEVIRGLLRITRGLTEALERLPDEQEGGGAGR